MARLRKALRDVATLDLRSLAAFRVTVALVLLYDLAGRGRNLTAHYTELGVLPVAQAAHEFGSGVYFAAHTWASASPWAVGAIFFLHAAAGIALLLGYRTRIASIASWYLLASLQVRNDYAAMMAGDDYLRLMLFWGIFLPLGARWSLDAARIGRPTVKGVATIGTIALLIQIFLLYFGTGLLKTGPMWADGTAVYYALNLHQYETPLTHVLLEQRWAIAPLTHFTLWTERLGALLLFVPFWISTARLLAITLFAGMHIGLALFMDIGPFPAMALCGWAAVIPGAFWDFVLPRLRRLGGRTAPTETSAPGPNPRMTWPLRAVAAASLAYVVAYQSVLLGFVGSGIANFPSGIRMYGKMLRLHQNWQMFAPDPSPTAIWFGVEGRLADGSTYDPYRDMEVTRGKPANIPASTRDFRWRLYTWTALITNFDSPDFLKHHHDFASYLCWEWNSRHGGEKRLTQLRTVAFFAATDASGSTLKPPTFLFSHRCDDQSAVRGKLSSKNLTALPPSTFRISSSVKPASSISCVRTGRPAASNGTSVPPSQSEPSAT